MEQHAGIQVFDLQTAARAFARNGYAVHVSPCAQEARDYLCVQIHGTTVGFGDSMTLVDMGLFEALSAHNQVTDPQHPRSGQSFLDTARECLLTDVFLTSANAATMQGELVNLDGTGNRVAGSLFGHRKVYFVLGSNKLTDTLEHAVQRVRSVAAPQNARRLGLNTPCAITGRCANCASPQRICNGLMLYLKCMNDIQMEVILINQDLGF